MKEKIYSISDLNRAAKFALEDHLGSVLVEGEISRLTKHSSGHWYFTLKDEKARINAAMFRGANANVELDVKEGMKVRGRGRVTLYEANGSYQVVLSTMELAGLGPLQEQFEKLKAKLLAEGLFESSRKQPLPPYPRTIGVVTSATGAAFQDIRNILTRRFPNLHILLASARVQGVEAAPEIIRAIELLNADGRADVLIVGRGGGSVEDLWCFNEETVARAIIASAIPVISAVGHEIDFTIADFVADYRAPTPSAAAEIAVPVKEELVERLVEQRRKIYRILRQRFLEGQHKLTSASHQLSHTLRQKTRYRERITRAHMQLPQFAKCQIETHAQLLDGINADLQFEAQRQLSEQREKLTLLATQLRAFSPQNVLERGYTLTTRPDGTLINSARQIKAGETLQTRLHDGTIESTVTG